MPTQIHNSATLPAMAPLAIPYPTMPHSQPIHMKMMDTVLHHRLNQIKHLSHHHVHFVAFSSRLAQLVNADIIDGEYSELLLRHRRGNADEVARHYVALMYRAVDERLSKEDRLHAVRCVKESSRLLREFLGKIARREELNESQSDMGDVMEVDVEGGSDGCQKKRRSIDMPSADGIREDNSKKRSRIDPGQQEKRKGGLKSDEIKEIGGAMTDKETAGTDIDERALESTSADEAVQDRSSTKATDSIKPGIETRPSEENQTPTTSEDAEKSTAPVENSACNDDMSVSTSSAIEEIASPDHQKTAIQKNISAPSTSTSSVEPSDAGDKMNAVQEKPVPTAQQLQAQSAKETQKSSTEMPNARGQQAKPSAPPAIEANSTVPFLANMSIASDSTSQNVPTAQQLQAQSAKETQKSSTEMPNARGQQAKPSAPPAIEANSTVPFLANTSITSESSSHCDARSTHETTKARNIRGSYVSDVEIAAAPSTQSENSQRSELKSKSVDGGSSKKPADVLKDTNKDADGKETVTKPSAPSSDSSKSSNQQTNSNPNLSPAATSAFQPLNSSASTTIASAVAASATTTSGSDCDEANGNKETAEVSASIQKNEAANQSSSQSSINKENHLKPDSVEQKKTDSKSQTETPNANKTSTSTTPENTTADDDFIIDLITPPGTPRAEDPSKSAENEASKAPTPTVKQLPPSPPPVTKILVPLPDPFSDPRPFNKTNSVTFLADDQIQYQSGGLHPRPSNLYNFDSGYHADGSGACLEHTTYLDVQTRLSTWEPYWRIVEGIGLHSVKASESGHTFVGTRTAACIPKFPNANSSSVNSCAKLTLNLPCCKKESLVGIKWGRFANPDCIGPREKDKYKTGDKRLILRTLPLHRTAKDKKKRADTHIWPKGTLIQLGRSGGNGGSLNDEKFAPILQRRQEKHDETSWKGMSHMLDLTRYSNPQQAMSVKLCTAEIVESTTSGTIGSYALHASICEYISPDDLYDQLMGKKSGGDVLIPTLSERSAKILAMDYVASQTVALEDSEDEDAHKTPLNETNSLTLSLLCPMKRTPMETPVRGRNCKHLQCFDLRCFLHINENVSGGRWRCGNCENFISVRDLIHCGLFQTMIDKYKGDISVARDKVSLQSDGSFYLKEENKLRYANKRPSATSKASDSAEIIDLD